MPARRQSTTRKAILDKAMDLASVEGLEGLSIGRLAGELGMSKSGVIGHFASKEDLQLNTLRAAERVFEARVLEGLEAEPGLARLRLMCERWIDYVASDCFAGGCFFWAASAEFDGRPGAVRERLARVTGQWLEQLRAEARLAQRTGELDADLDPAQLAFELHAFVQEANWAGQLLEDAEAFDRARRAVGSRLERARSGRD